MKCYPVNIHKTQTHNKMNISNIERNALKKTSCADRQDVIEAQQELNALVNRASVIHPDTEIFKELSELPNESIETLGGLCRFYGIIGWLTFTPDPRRKKVVRCEKYAEFREQLGNFERRAQDKYACLFKRLEGPEPKISELSKKQLNSKFQYASVGNDLIGTEKFLTAGADVNSKWDCDGETVLHLAAARGNVEMIGLLIKHKIDINLQSKWGITALTEGARKGQLEVVGTLLEAGADEGIRDKEGGTMLHWLVKTFGAFAMLKTVLKLRAEINLNVLNNKGMTPLDIAIKTNNKRVIKLLEEGMGIDYIKKNKIVLDFC